MSQVSEWSDPPQMSTGAPMPGIYSDGSDLFLAYIVQTGPPSEFEEFAVIKFSGVLQHVFGYPNDEALGGHPYYKLGLHFYAFNVVSDSPYLVELGKRNAKVFKGTDSFYRGLVHWIVPFHDATLEVVGRSAEVVGRIEAKNARSAIDWYLGCKPELDRPAKRSFVDS